MSEPGDGASEDGYQSDSSSSDETDDEFISTRKLFVQGTCLFDKVSIVNRSIKCFAQDNYSQTDF